MNGVFQSAIWLCDAGHASVILGGGRRLGVEAKRAIKETAALRRRRLRSANWP